VNVASNQGFRGELRIDEPMSEHTSWRLGGPADHYFIPADLADLQHYLSTLERDAELLWIGLGSNLLIRDGGFRGHVIAPFAGLNRLELLEQDEVYVECGVSCAKVARFCQKRDLGNADFFAGIPGTVGGALAMNAGAFGGETWQSVTALTMINRAGVLTERNPDEFEVAYREVHHREDEWFAAANFRFARRAKDEPSNLRQLLQQRNQSQPIGQPSCGSVFRNPEGRFAARLIEEAGLKGLQFGNVQVSAKHANFIISNPNSRAAEVEALIAHIQKTVLERFDIALQREVHITGETL
jgi:UDP-N-acetylmuramate dehydrogenase